MPLPPKWRRTAVVAQAQGMVAEQANCSPIAALALMHERAVAQGRSLDEVAMAVVAREDRFGV